MSHVPVPPQQEVRTGKGILYDIHCCVFMTTCKIQKTNTFLLNTYALMTRGKKQEYFIAHVPVYSRQEVRHKKVTLFPSACAMTRTEQEL